MDNFARQAVLCDFYGELLSGHQREILEASVMDNDSLSEIAHRFGITRQAASDMIRRCVEKLEGYEERLGLIERFMRLEKGLTRIRELSLSLDSGEAEEILSIADDLLKEL